jgi:AraC family transcriptional regulator
MDWPQEMNKAMALYGVKRRFSNKDGEKFVAIPKMWDELTKDKTVRKITEKGDGFLYGACYDFSKDCSEFSYMIASKGEEEGMEALVIPEATYAKFSAEGVQGLQDMTKEIYSEWLPSSGYKHDDRPELEVYPPHCQEEEEWPVELWVPTVKA